MQNLEIQSIDIIDLARVTGGQAGGQQQPAPTNPPPANPGVNADTYRYGGGELGRIGGELLGSDTAAKHLERAGQKAGEAVYNAGEWLGRQAGRLIYGN